MKIVAKRVRVAGEIIPVSVEQSATQDNDEVKFGVANAIDMDLDTLSVTETDSNGNTWLKITLDKIHCVEQVIRYKNDGTPAFTWTCTDTDCSNCENGDDFCQYFTLTVSTEGAVSDLSPVSDCKYGDTVKLEKSVKNQFKVHEIAVLGKEGKYDY